MNILNASFLVSDEKPDRQGISSPEALQLKVLSTVTDNPCTEVKNDK